MTQYRGRLAPTPSGYFHLGHASTFWIAQQRALQHGGTLVLRVEDLDRDRCKPEYLAAMYEDFRWLGLHWQEGPEIGGPYAPYRQSECASHYRSAWRQLLQSGQIYPSPHSRQDVQRALQAPHEGEDEPIFPVELRPPTETRWESDTPGAINWRFRVPEGETIAFIDGRLGSIERTAGKDFGDFVVWRKDGVPSYELAVVADDHRMAVSEVVRGEDLLTSTARQLLLYRALGWAPPAFFHCPLVRDCHGRRLAKRDQSTSLRALRAVGHSADEILGQIRQVEVPR